MFSKATDNVFNENEVVEKKGTSTEKYNFTLHNCHFHCTEKRRNP